MRISDWSSDVCSSDREGRDAGSLTIKASAAAMDGTLVGDAFAGSRQIIEAQAGGAGSSIFGDRRLLQAAVSQLPAGGYFSIQALSKPDTGSVAGGADIRIVTSSDHVPLASALDFGQSLSIGADGGLLISERDLASFLPVERRNTIILSDQALNDAGLSQLSLSTSGSLTFDAGTDLVLRPGGVLVGQSGRAVQVDGAIPAESGAIDPRSEDRSLGKEGVSPFR